MEIPPRLGPAGPTPESFPSCTKEIPPYVEIKTWDDYYRRIGDKSIGPASSKPQKTYEEDFVHAYNNCTLLYANLALSYRTATPEEKPKILAQLKKIAY
jgi:hypothetical protein